MLKQFAWGLLCAALVSPFATASSAQDNPQPQAAGWIKGSIDENQRFVLSGNTRPEAVAANDKGPVPDGLEIDHMQLALRRAPNNEQALRQYMAGLTNRQSQNFHRWLTADQIASRYGAAPQDVRIVTGWLVSHGFRVNGVYRATPIIDFSGSVGKVSAAFHTQIHYLSVHGEQHFANMSDPKLPAALAPAVVGVVSLHDFRPHAESGPTSNYSFAGCSGTCYAVVPADIWKIYKFPIFNTSNAGQHQVIAVIENSDVYSTQDWYTFRTEFGLSSFPGSFSQQHPQPPPGGTSFGFFNCTDPKVGANAYEATLDAEWASAAAPGAAIELMSCEDVTLAATPGVFIALENLVNTPIALHIISISYSECEKSMGTSFWEANAEAMVTAASEGTSVFVSAGDAGAANCDEATTKPLAAKAGLGINGLASADADVAVGGTDFGDVYAAKFGGASLTTYWSKNTSVYGSALGYIPEIPWDDSCASTLLAMYVTGSVVTYGPQGFCSVLAGKQFLTISAGGGGASVDKPYPDYPKPSWQIGIVGMPGDNSRDIPDVSLFAGDWVWNHQYIVCYSGKSNTGQPLSCAGAPSSWAKGGGTSFGTPIWAGIQALVNQSTGAVQGFPDPVYYELAAAEYGAGGNAACNSSKGKQVGAACVFYDVTEGNMDVDCTGTDNCYSPGGANYGVLSTSNSAYKPAYGAGIGWDFATGIGTPNVTNLINQWNTAAAAATVFELQGLKFSDGGTAAGSFELLSSACIRSTSCLVMAVNIVTTSTKTFVGNSYASCDEYGSMLSACAYFKNGSYLYTVQLAPLNSSGGQPIRLLLDTKTPLSLTQSTPITRGGELECSNSTCSTYVSRGIISGTIVPVK